MPVFVSDVDVVSFVVERAVTLCCGWGDLIFVVRAFILRLFCVSIEVRFFVFVVFRWVSTVVLRDVTDERFGVEDIRFCCV